MNRDTILQEFVKKQIYKQGVLTNWKDDEDDDADPYYIIGDPLSVLCELVNTEVDGDCLDVHTHILLWLNNHYIVKSGIKYLAVALSLEKNAFAIREFSTVKSLFAKDSGLKFEVITDSLGSPRDCDFYMTVSDDDWMSCL